MQPITLSTLLSLWGLFLLIQALNTEANDQLQNDVPDAFKFHCAVETDTEIIQNWEAKDCKRTAIALYDEDRDGDLDCLKAIRTEFDEDGQIATYVWLLKNQNGHDNTNITYHFEGGASPDKPVLTVDNVPDPEQDAEFIYTDYETCTITHLPYKGRQECILWTSEDAKRDVAQHCIDKYRATCDVVPEPYDESCDAL